MTFTSSITIKQVQWSYIMPLWDFGHMTTFRIPYIYIARNIDVELNWRFDDLQTNRQINMNFPNTISPGVVLFRQIKIRQMLLCGRFVKFISRQYFRLYTVFTHIKAARISSAESNSMINLWLVVLSWRSVFVKIHRNSKKKHLPIFTGNPS